MNSSDNHHFEVFSAILHNEKHEDRVYDGHICGRWPVILLADGISVQEDAATGNAVMGLGGIAAQHAIEAARAYLERRCTQVRTLEEVLLCLEEMYPYMADAMSAASVFGATTFLAVILWRSETTRDQFWCYSYEGDGYINLLPSKRTITGKVPTQRLLSPQKIGQTASVSRRGTTIKPAVGCRAYEDGDIMYVASDGIAPLDGWLRVNSQTNSTLTKFITSNTNNIGRLAEILATCPDFGDDASMGIIWRE